MIVLATLNAKFAHSSLGLRYLYANMGELQEKTQMMEFSILDNITTIAEKIYDQNPRVLGLSIYIWNAKQTLELLKIVRKILPNTKVILGGPEVSYTYNESPFFDLCDYIITKEGDLLFAKLCKDIIDQKEINQKVFEGKISNLSEIKYPYEYYSDEDIKHRYMYVESSRGCPFHCDFCLSSIDNQVRMFHRERFLAELEKLWQRGARNFKFIDRTFNLNLVHSLAILDFFLNKIDEKPFLHFELVPEHLPEKLKEKIKQFPPNTLQFEIGIQTMNPEIATNISRKMNNQRIVQNIIYLKENSHAHLHTDLIVGLPGEDLASFHKGFDKLLVCNPHEIQVGILKKLGGTKIKQHDNNWEMKYNPNPPYNILANKLISFDKMQNMSRFARFWDLLYNSGNFNNSVKLIWADESPFTAFYHFSNWLYENGNATHSISLDRLSEFLFNYLVTEKKMEKEIAQQTILDDFMKVPGRRVPKFIRKQMAETTANQAGGSTTLHKRQQKHSR